MWRDGQHRSGASSGMIRARVFGNYTSFSSDFLFLFGFRFGVGHFLFFHFPSCFYWSLNFFAWVIFGVFVSFSVSGFHIVMTDGKGFW